MAMPSGRRLLNIVIASVGLIVTSPLFLLAAVGIVLSSPGPILYRSRRIGQDRRRPREGQSGGSIVERREPGYRGRPFTMYKFRTMRVSTGPQSPITAHQDRRVFWFGAWLRATKIDELPQLINVLKGDMALVGPRPEDPEIVKDHYSTDDIGTLQVAPGLTSPGALYYYSQCEEQLEGEVVEVYVDRLLPRKLAIDRVYIRRASVTYDLQVIARTILVVLARVTGSRRFPSIPELHETDSPPALSSRAPKS